MFKWLIGFSLRHSSLVFVVAGLVLVYAGVNLQRIPVDVFPELNAPTVVIMAESRGMAADEVENFVTFPIETAVGGLPGLRRVRSASAISLSIVWVEFEFGYDIYRARQLVAERMATVEDRLPEGVHADISPITGLAGEIMLISVTSPDDSAGPLELRAWAEFDLTNRLLAVPGVAQVVSMGGKLPEFQVNVDQEKLALYGLSIDDVIAATREAHAGAAAGYLPEHEGREIPLRQTGRAESPEDLRSTILTRFEGAPVTLGDVADVRIGAAPARGTAAEGGGPAVIMSVLKSPDTNTLELTRAIDEMLAGIALLDAEGNPTDLVRANVDGRDVTVRVNSHAMRQANFINRAVNNVVVVLRDAAILVAIVLILFLMNVRTTLITLTALPLSLALALLLLWLTGLNINVMTLGGLAVAIGELVDDAIIDVENVFRRLRENRALPQAEQLPHTAVVYRGSNEIRSAIVFATMIIGVVWVPLLFLEGLEGLFFKPLGLAYILAITASLLVAVTVTPAMCKVLLRKAPRRKGPERESLLVRGLKRLYEPSVRTAIRLRWLVMALALCGTVASLWVASTYGTRFLPEFNEGTYTVFLMAPPGTSLLESDRLARGAEGRIAEIEGVSGVVRRTGRAERDEHAEPASSSEIEVTVKPGYRRETIRRKIDEILAEVPGVTTMIDQPIAHRLSHVLSGVTADVAIDVYGDDLATLRAIAADIERELNALPGARDIAANREIMVETLPIRYNRRELALVGLTPRQAATQVEAAFHGVRVAEANVGAARYDITVRLGEPANWQPDDVKNLILHTGTGGQVRLSDVADIGPEMASNLIAREGARRKAVISLNVAEGYNLGHLISQVRERVDPIVRRHGYSVNYGGQFEAQQSAQRTLLIFGALVVLVILALLFTVLKSFKAALLVMVNLPLALIGGVVAVFIAESPDPLRNLPGLFGLGPYVAPVLSIASLVGFITLFGIAVRNGVLLVTHYRRLQLEDDLPLMDAVVRGSMERLVPILMTALTAMLGLVPLALAAGEPGSELLAPLAVVVLGGLVTSTALNLVVVPAGYVMINPDPEALRAREREAESIDLNMQEPPTKEKLP
jgi:CzcA family heavy metal efflux pump